LQVIGQKALCAIDEFMCLEGWVTAGHVRNTKLAAVIPRPGVAHLLHAIRMDRRGMNVN
jgi:hypothetical protein